MTESATNTNTQAKGSKAKVVVDREKTCPFLLRMFCKEAGHHSITDYSTERQPTEDEVQIYTWKDATLKELANLLKEINPEAQRMAARLSFKLVYQDNVRGRYVFKDLGMISLTLLYSMDLSLRETQTRGGETC
ncbi:8524_t:CDS:2 [Paraglomus occultum]|uniref:8524_t:CDS:1 n=1 Tax=Paraglomus occultum TaxID=144539 RepID=A0A9N8WGW8_9GLOM|nr:8524_t:CDS:2 [Paraglomus occultum]